MVLRHKVLVSATKVDRIIDHIAHAHGLQPLTLTQHLLLLLCLLRLHLLLLLHGLLARGLLRGLFGLSMACRSKLSVRLALFSGQLAFTGSALFFLDALLGVDHALFELGEVGDNATWLHALKDTGLRAIDVGGQPVQTRGRNNVLEVVG